MSVRIIVGDCRDALATLPAESVHCCVTSPPYWGLRDYGVGGQLGLEADYRDFITVMLEVFREVRRVLRADGTLWLNLGDSYSRSFAKGGSGPNGKHDFIPDYGKARSAMAGSSDGQVRRGDRPGSRANGLKEKDLMMMPSRVALVLQEDGWYVRSEIIWAKPNPMPESVSDRPTSAHEKVFLLSKSARYFFDQEAVREENADPTRTNYRPGPEAYTDGNVHDSSGRTRRNDGFAAYANGKQCVGRNLRNVWTIATAPFSEAHFATFPPELAERRIKAGCPAGGTVLDPFGGAGTTGLVADRLGRNAILIELNPDYAGMARRRIAADSTLFADVKLETPRAEVGP